MFHKVCPLRQSKPVLDRNLKHGLNRSYLERMDRCKVEFLEIGGYNNSASISMLSISKYWSTKVVHTIKRITAITIFTRISEATKELWDSNYLNNRFFRFNIGEHRNERKISNYVKNQATVENYKILLDKQKPTKNQIILSNDQYYPIICCGRLDCYGTTGLS